MFRFHSLTFSPTRHSLPQTFFAYSHRTPYTPSHQQTTMKFAKQLSLRIIPNWTDYYVDYKALKKYIKEASIEYIESKNDPNVLSKISDHFRELLIAQLQKVEGRYLKKSKEGNDQLEALNAVWWSDTNAEEQVKWREDMTKLLTALEYLTEFTQTNITGFQKILKKYDKHFRANVIFSSSAVTAASSAMPLEPLSPTSPIIFDGTPQPAANGVERAREFAHRGSVTAMGKEMWGLVTACKFVRSEDDENLLFRARQLYRKRVPPLPPTDADHLNQLHIVESDIPTVTDLDLDALPMGKISRLWVVMAEDGMSQPIKVPVIVAKGLRDGPVVGMTAALHGNELNGIPLIHRLFSQELQLSALHGTVVAVPVTNVPGYLSGVRTFNDGVDLNRLMPGKKNGSISQVYAYNLMERIVSKFNYLIDLHTASKGRVNSLYVRSNMVNEVTREMSRLQNPQIIVHNTSPDGSLRGAAMERGISAITVEIGDPARFQKRFVKNALLGVTNFLGHLKMLPDEHDLPEFDPVVCSKSYWIFSSGGGILNVLPDVNSWVKKGETIATLHNIFGKLEHSYMAPEDGIVIGKSIDPVCQTGSRILHLGVVDSRYPTTKVDDGHQ